MSQINPKELDPAFQALGSPKAGIEIWRIEKLTVVSLPKADYGKFHTGDSYIVLKTNALKSGGFSFAIHFWLGKETSQDEAGAAAIKTVELDAYLGGKATQYREVQGHESDLFLSYFRPCIIALPGGVATGFKPPTEVQKETRLYQVKAQRFVRVRQVPFARTSLSHSDVFLLDTPEKIFQFNGANCSRTEQGKAMEVTQALKREHEGGKCPVEILEDGKMGDGASAEFWAQFGGYAPISKKSSGEDDVEAKITPARLIWAARDGLKEAPTGGLKKNMLESNKCYLLDCGADIYVWIGRISSLEERKMACTAAEDLIKREKRPISTRIVRVADRYETPMFKSNFDEWPVVPIIGEGASSRLKGMLKQAGVVDVKAMAKGTPATAEPSSLPPLTDISGKIDVWRVDGKDKSPVPSAEIGKFYSGDSYIVQYTYPKERKNEYLVFFWLGKKSTQEARGAAAILATKMAEKLRGQHILARIVQGKEPEQFLSLFKGNLLFLKGGLSSSYKEAVGSADDTYTANSVALLLVKGIFGDKVRVTQLEPTSKSLSSSDCFILQTPSTMYTWIGKFSSDLEKKAAATAAEILKPGTVPKQQVEGKEISAFWTHLGGKGEYASSRESKDVLRDARLFACSNVTGALKVSEVYNYIQDDLLSEDVMILDAYSEIFVWVGSQSNDQEKSEAFNIAQKYLDQVVALEGRSKDTAIIKIQEGNEPPMFTAHFTWDPARASTFMDPYERRLAELQDRPIELTEAQKRRLGMHLKDSAAPETSSVDAAPSPTPDSEPPKPPSPSPSPASAASQRAAALAALAGSVGSTLGSKKEKKESLNIPASEPEVEPEPASKPASASSAASQRAAALAALSGSLTAEKPAASGWSSFSSVFKHSPKTVVSPVSTPTPIREPKPEPEKDPEPEPEPEPVKIKATEEPVPEPVSEPEAPPTPEVLAPEQAPLEEEGTFPYDRLVSNSDFPAMGVDSTKRESYLSKAEFERIFGLSKESFYALPKWKQDQKKRVVSLF